MNRIINKLRNPIIVTVLMVSIVLIPFISSPFTEVHAEDIYQAYTKSGEYPASDHLKNPIYVRPNGSNDKGDVAYCFNDHRSFPESSFSPRKTLYTKELGTAAKFEELADTERVTGQDLYNGLVRVIYNGYPNNKSGIKERYGLTDGQFRQITQYAVWYYTDTFNMPARDTSGNNFTENEKNAFNDLVNSTTAIPAGTKLDIYRSKDNAYQNLLSGHFQPNTPQPQPQPQPTTKEVEFSKVKLGGTELAGAQIEIYKGTQKVSEWTSTTASKKIQLEPGTYRFHEEAAPAGFLAVTDFTFTVNADGTVTLGAIAQGETVVAANGKITVTDNDQTTPTPQPTTKEIEFSKVKLGGTELAGAQIEIYKGTQKVSEWTSTTTSHKIQLEPGTYRFHEEAAPAGFLAVTDFTFTVNADGTVTLGAIAQGETIVAANGKITVTDNAQTTPTPTPTPAPSPSPTPTTPGTTPKPGAKKPSVVVKSKSPKTGDEGNFAQYALLLLSSGIALSAIGYNRRKNVK